MSVTGETSRRAEQCDDLDQHPAVETAADPECGECVAEGTRWVHLRQCLACNRVACCDSSPRRHASAHFHDSGHAVMQSAEPGEAWRWCFVHHVTG